MARRWVRGLARSGRSTGGGRTELCISRFRRFILHDRSDFASKRRNGRERLKPGLETKNYGIGIVPLFLRIPAQICVGPLLPDFPLS
jgi:hypothetical protein